MNGQVMLEVSQLEVAYGGIRAVKGIDLKVEAGEVVALIGANGAGKTTTLKALAGLLRPKGGSVTYNGADATGKPAYHLVRHGLALVPEGRGMFPRLTVAENLAMGAYIRSDAAGVAADTDRVCALFPRLAERAGNMGNQLSGGEQQRVAIARALANDPFVLLADEPTGNLDDRAKHAIFLLLREINAQGTAVLMATHDVAMITRSNLRFLELDHGALVHDGTDAARLLADMRGRR